MRPFFPLILVFACCLPMMSVDAAPSSPASVDSLVYELNYQIVLDIKRQGAQVNIDVDKGILLKHIRFQNPKNRYTDIKANGKVVFDQQQVIWELPEGKSRLSFFVKITHERDPGKFDALMTKDWAIFRGDDLIPAIHTLEAAGAYSHATLTVLLPEGWENIETGWPKQKDKTFLIDNPDRRFDRPTGWIIAGKLGTRRATVNKTAIAISAPKGENFKRMDALTFLNFVWPEIHDAFEVTPKKLLIVGAGDPMWRGGLSATNSLFLHAERPLVSENGTSPLLHELTHMLTRISGATTDATNDDWIAEGLAEFYSFEILYRAKGMTKHRRAKIIANLAKWGADVKHLRKSKSTGPVTARAVVLLDELDKEIRKRTNNKHNIDDVTRQLISIRKVSYEDLLKISEGLVGGKLQTFASPLLN